MKKIIILTALPFVLFGCGLSQQSAEIAQPKPTEAEATQFGLWQVENCHVAAERAGITLATTHHLSDDTIRLKLSSAQVLDERPEVTLNALPHLKIDLEGKGQHYGATLPYSGRTVARMIRDDSFIVVKFTPEAKAGGKAQQAYFSTRGLAEAVTHLAQNCK